MFKGSKKQQPKIIPSVKLMYVPPSPRTITSQSHMDTNDILYDPSSVSSNMDQDDAKTPIIQEDPTSPIIQTEIQDEIPTHPIQNEITNNSINDETISSIIQDVNISPSLIDIKYSNLTSNSVVISWSPPIKGPPADDYSVMLAPYNDLTHNVVETTSNLSCTINNLISSRNYIVYVHSNMNGKSLYFSHSIYFTTLGSNGGSGNYLNS